MFQLQEMVTKLELLKMKRDLDKLSVFMPGSKNLVHESSESMKEHSKEEETETAKKITLVKSGSHSELPKEDVSDEDI